MMGKIKEFYKRYIVRDKIMPIKTPVYDGKLLEGKIALIIGGSGGIGAGIAQCFATNGCKVILAGTNRDKLESNCKKIGCDTKYILWDICQIESFRSKVDEAAALFGRIDILVNSAGVHGTDPFGNVKEETWDKVLDINLKGMYFMCQEVSKYMIEHGIKGHILNVSSASCAKPGWTPYEISKWGVRGLTLGLADKLVSKGIIVNSIAPGPVATTMLGRETGDNLTWPGNPTGRMATAEEIGNLAVFMVSQMGDLIVGDTYFISGGSGTTCIDK